jgi:hypothetical protein
MATLMSLENGHAEVLEKIIELYSDLFQHEGYGNMSIEMKFLKKGQKEVLIKCGKDFRFVVDYNEEVGANGQIAKKIKSFQLAK